MFVELFERGIQPIPIQPKSKAPIKECEGFSEWSIHGIPEGKIEEFEQKYSENYNIAILLGPASGVMEVDIDTDDPEILAAIPNSPVVRQGRPGRQGRLFRYNPEIKNHNFSMGSNGHSIGVDILCSRKYVVIPPSIHPDTGLPYKWLSYETVESIDKSDLPSFTTQDLAKLEEIFKRRKQELKGLPGVHTTTDSGRNNKIKSIITAMRCEGKNEDEIVDRIYEYDLKHHKPRLFTDPKEDNAAKDEDEAHINAFKLVASITSSLTRNGVKFKNTNKESSDQPENSKEPEQIGFYYRFRIPKEGGGVKLVDAPQYNLMAQHCFDKKMFCFDDAISLKFDGRMWKWLSKNEMTSFVRNQNKELIKPFHIDNFVKMIKAACFVGNMEIKPHDGLINVNNGIVDIRTGGLLPHDHRYLFKYIVPVDYSSDAKCPRWHQFLSETFEGNAELIDLSQRMFGYILMGGEPFFHKAFVLVGNGRNGKSTYLDILRAIIGSESYSAISMSKISKEFSIVQIDGKLANVVEETPNEEINSEVFKTLVGGGEIQAAHKGFDEFRLKCNARFVFSCNDMPLFKDKSVGLEDRLMFIPFNRYLPEQERDTTLKEKLLAEISGIFNWALEGAKTVMKERSLPNYETTRLSKELYRVETDPLYAWFKDFIVVTATPRCEQSIDSLFKVYKRDCDESGNMAYSKMKFSKRLRTLVQTACREQGIEYDREFKANKNHDSESRGFNVVNYKGHPALF